ncbi:hypothetical protein B0H16DRAFT_1600288 [Mycena metata]|uniref:Uncharacterized protein n=1 Tax=Mycena metata TaxID=1033252 RepID=A0AAD7HK04_9AGAR|nr:hypothetical protein B0H16DRAFT_1600288 [Mycena metata]
MPLLVPWALAAIDTSARASAPSRSHSMDGPISAMTVYETRRYPSFVLPQALDGDDRDSINPGDVRQCTKGGDTSMLSSASAACSRLSNVNSNVSCSILLAFSLRSPSLSHSSSPPHSLPRSWATSCQQDGRKSRSDIIRSSRHMFASIWCSLRTDGLPLMCVLLRGCVARRILLSGDSMRKLSWMDLQYINIDEGPLVFIWRRLTYTILLHLLLTFSEFSRGFSKIAVT